MYLFSKYFSPRNFVFADGLADGKLSVGSERFDFEADACGDDVYHIRIRNASKWPLDPNRAGIAPLPNANRDGKGRHTHLHIGQDGGFALRAGMRTFLSTLHGAAFGVSGNMWLFQFRQRADMQFYGMGEKSTPFEKSDRVHRFWNTDVWADHGTSRAKDQLYDPDYISIPYLIIKRGNTYAGILLDNLYASVISVSPRLNVANQMMAQEHQEPFIYLGAEDGPPGLYILFGPSLAELTMKLQNLVGRPPLPPLWSLGYHQCRWGYQSASDLRDLADNYEKLEYPVDGLWLDIDYMRGYRVFTFEKEHFPDPARDIEEIRKRGFRVVPILDPGVKKEPGFDVYDGGSARGVFCRNAAGTEFTGVVWPGYTAFPDFSLEKTQEWWAEHVAEFARICPDGAWLDMNDPSTGPVDCMAMLFDEGRAPHQAYHNQYAMLMAEATRKGYLKARPNHRPFLLSRSGCTGSQKFTAHWTGDNWSNYHHLHMSIGKTLNLALSGMAINAGDLAGFGGNCKEDLFIDWYKAGFLFPFLRNHSMRTSHYQEPWRYSREAVSITRRFVRLRYKLLPYLYNLVIRHCEAGEAVMRPLFHDFPDTKKLPLAHVSDQFLVGPCIMQAPFTDENRTEREIVLPEARWWRADGPAWVDGPAKLKARKRPASTPIFIRDGSLIPMQKGVTKDNRKELRDIDLFVCLSKEFRGKASTRYAVDDGETFDYLKGARTEVRLEAEVREGELRVTAAAEASGFGAVRITPVTVVNFEAVWFDDGSGARRLSSVKEDSDAWGVNVTFYRWE